MRILNPQSSIRNPKSKIKNQKSKIPNPSDLLTREHRLYQVDWLIRRYRFSADEIPFEPDGSLSLAADPKEIWANQHPENFPVAINRAGRFSLLRVPGLGEISVQKILNYRNAGNRIRSIEDLGRVTKRLQKAKAFLRFD